MVCYHSDRIFSNRRFDDIINKMNTNPDIDLKFFKFKHNQLLIKEDFRKTLDCNTTSLNDTTYENCLDIVNDFESLTIRQKNLFVQEHESTFKSIYHYLKTGKYTNQGTQLQLLQF